MRTSSLGYFLQVYIVPRIRIRVSALDRISKTEFNIE
jgi:hypothetical protein